MDKTIKQALLLTCFVLVAIVFENSGHVIQKSGEAGGERPSSHGDNHHLEDAQQRLEDRKVHQWNTAGTLYNCPQSKRSFVDSVHYNRFTNSRRNLALFLTISFQYHFDADYHANIDEFSV